ncbi:MAG TPA: alpha-amylase, partial [Anaerolineales bacterium]|nr:alpha-amylase [Anaerolineales bacterium]
MRNIHAVNMEFHVSRRARDNYQFDLSLFSLSGNVILANFYAARIFAQRINQKRDLIRYPERAVRAGQINAMGLIDEILHYILELYRQQVNAEVMGQALQWIYDQIGEDEVKAALRQFADEFPPVTVYRRQTDLDDYLEDNTDGVPNRRIVLEEM